MGFLRWLKWWFCETRRCEHVRDPEPSYPNMGMNKAWHCAKCRKCLEFI